MTNETYITEHFFDPTASQRRILNETFLEDMFLEFRGRASARWSTEMVDAQPDSARVRMQPKLHYIEINTPHRIIRFEHDEITPKTYEAVMDALEEDLECMS